MQTLRRVASFVLLPLLFLTALAGDAAAAPRLIVVIVVDQMRADYIDRFGHQWTAGLRRLVDSGAWFRQAAYPYLSTVTCPGHATIATGSFPTRHGMIQNTWWDRETNAVVACTADPQTPVLSYGAPVTTGHSLARLRLPTLTDEMRAQLPAPPRIVSLSLKARASLPMAGRAADLVLWFEVPGVWVSSTAYGTSPVPWVQDFLQRHPVEQELDREWTRALPDDRYLFDDLGVGERPGAPRTAAFPHPLRAESPARSFELWTESPFADAYLGELAHAAVDALGLGQAERTDFLHVSFSTLDLVGHDFGPRSHEVQDILVQLDRTIGTLLDRLDRQVGPDNYVVAFSSDHGVSLNPDSATAMALDAGRMDTSAAAAELNAAIAAVLGPGRYVARWHFTDIYFEPGVYEQLTTQPAALEAAVRAVGAIPGVWQVYRSEDLRDGRPTADRLARSAALSYYPGRSGDLVIVPRPHWIVSPAPATHGTLHQYDTRVPLVLFGAGIEPGRYLEPVTPADIAPTLAFLAGVTLAQTDGRVLVEGLRGMK